MINNVSSKFFTGFRGVEKPFSKTNADKDVKTSIFYMNDLHSRPASMDSIKIKSDEFKRSNSDADKFELAAGDIKSGLGDKINDLTMRFMNLIGIDLSALGNHEFDCGETKLQEQIDKINEYARKNNQETFKFVSTNLDIDEKSPLSKSLKEEKIVKSWIMNRNGNDYGFIGATTTSLNEAQNINSNLQGISIKNLEKTIESIQKEVNTFKEKGINKIILLSHLGYDDDVQAAQKISGLDIIVGGHSHNLIKDLTTNQSLFTSATNEPVVIVQAGKDGQYVGTLDVIFDSEGKIKSAKNNIFKTENAVKDPEIQSLKDEIMGKAEVLGSLKEDYKPIKSYACENPLASFFADAMKLKSGAQISLLINDAFLVKNGINKGEITNRDIDNLTSYKNNVLLTSLSGKEIFEILNWSSTKTKQPSPIQVSGINYKMNSSGQVKNICIENKDGTTTDLDPNQKYSVAYDSHLTYKANYANAQNILNIFNNSNPVNLNWDKGAAAIEYIKSFNNKPFEITSKNRISYGHNFAPTNIINKIIPLYNNVVELSKRFAKTA